MKFKKEKISSLSGDTHVVFSDEEPHFKDTPFKIVATPYGFYLAGRTTLLKDEKDLEDLAKTIQAARAEVKNLTHRIYTGGKDL